MLPRFRLPRLCCCPAGNGDSCTWHWPPNPHGGGIVEVRLRSRWVAMRYSFDKLAPLFDLAVGVGWSSPSAAREPCDRRIRNHQPDCNSRQPLDPRDRHRLHRAKPVGESARFQDESVSMALPASMASHNRRYAAVGAMKTTNRWQTTAGPSRKQSRPRSRPSLVDT